MVSTAASCSELLVGAGLGSVVLAFVLIGLRGGNWSKVRPRGQKERTEREATANGRTEPIIAWTVLAMVVVGLVATLVQLSRC